MAMSEKERKQLMGLLIGLPLLGIIGYWMYPHASNTAEMAELERRIDSLETAVDSARRDLAEGTVEELRARVREYEQSLVLMRQLVPTRGEVTNLLDDIARRATVRGVEISAFAPAGTVDTGAFQTQRYQFTVYGHYDEIGAFLSDIAALPRIMVPYQVSLIRARPDDASSRGDTTGSLLSAEFLLRTFIKRPPMEEEAGETS